MPFPEPRRSTQHHTNLQARVHRQTTKTETDRESACVCSPLPWCPQESDKVPKPTTLKLKNACTTVRHNRRELTTHPVMFSSPASKPFTTIFPCPQFARSSGYDKRPGTTPPNLGGCSLPTPVKHEPGHVWDLEFRHRRLHAQKTSSFPDAQTGSAIKQLTGVAKSGLLTHSLPTNTHGSTAVGRGTLSHWHQAQRHAWFNYCSA